MNVDAMFHKLSAAGKEWADLQAKAQHWEEMRRPFRSQLVADLLKDGMPVSKAEHLAQAKDEYEQHIVQMVNARKDANRARVNYDSLRVLADLRRTEAATRRSEMENLK